MSKKDFYDVREITDLKDMINQSSHMFPDKNAFLIKSDDDNYKGITYAQLQDDINAFGTGLAELGLKDEKVAVIGENRYEWCITYLSVVNGLGVIVPLDKELPKDEIVNLMATANASAVVFSGKLLTEIKEIMKVLPQVRFFINMDDNFEKEEDERLISYNDITDRGRELLAKGDESYIALPIDNEKMSILLFTSGTTGHAKGVMLSHKNICSNIVNVCKTVHFDNNDAVLSILPLHHTYECTCGFLAMLYNGVTISFTEGLRHIGKNIKEVSPTTLILVPLLLENMYNKIWEQAAKMKGGKLKLKTAMLISNILHKVLRIDLRRKIFKQVLDNFGGKLRIIIIGAAPVEPSVSKGFYNMGVTVLQGYGLTECSPLAAGNRDKQFRHNSIGLPIPEVSVKIDNPDKNGIGELLVKGDNVMLGYFENQEATSKCLKDGWFYTGDIGYMDKQGFFYITGRSKNVIVTKNGKNIFPEEVESYVNKSPYVMESLVWGDYDEVSGDTLVSAQIVPNLDAIKEKLKVPNISKEDILKTLNDVVKSVNKNMPLYKRIQKFSIRETEFVKTTSKKIKRYMETMSIKDSNKTNM